MHSLLDSHFINFRSRDVLYSLAFEKSQLKDKQKEQESIKELYIF